MIFINKNLKSKKNNFLIMAFLGLFNAKGGLSIGQSSRDLSEEISKKICSNIYFFNSSFINFEKNNRKK